MISGGALLVDLRSVDCLKVKASTEVTVVYLGTGHPIHSFRCHDVGFVVKPAIQPQLS
jgi:hypothetical protein